MFYPKHQIRNYCVYLGSLECGKHKLDMGVYEHPDGATSHAIVDGNDDGDYLSGVFELDNPKYNFQSWYCKINEELYRKYLIFKGE